MHFDALTLACVADELRATILGGRVQQVLLVDDYTVGFEVYAQRERQYLVVSAAPGASRVHLSSTKLRRGATQETPLLLLLRKFIRGAILTEIMQPDPAERVLFLRHDHPEHGISTVVAEPIGRMGNVLLLDSSMNILDCMRRVPAGDNARRVLLPGRVYTPPPQQHKLPPLDDGTPDYYERLSTITAQDGTLWKAIVAQVAGVSPFQAREIAFRASGDAASAARDGNPLAVAQTLQELWAPVLEGGWVPGNVVETDSLVAFSPYPVGYRGEFIPRPSISDAIERFDADRNAAHSLQSNDQGVDEYAAARTQVASLIRQSRQRLNRQQDALAQDEPEPGKADALRAQAEWLLALGHTVQPGQDILEVDPYGDGSEILRIPLDLRKSPVEQAERMFKRAAKFERAAEVIPRRRARIEQDMAFLDQLESDLITAENRPEIAAVEDELRAAGFVKTAVASRQRRPPSSLDNLRTFTSPGGYEILAGRNARQNEAVTFKLSHPQDAWFHARGVPGSHVILRSRGAPVSDEDITAAARVAAFFSRARGERSAPVVVTERRHVRRVPHGHTGQVLVQRENVVHVPATLPRDMEETE